jgi:hypothetical protein
VTREETNGYYLVTDNCLEKALAIIAAYGVNDLPPGFFFALGMAIPYAPNDYFDDMLTGFEPVHYL